MKLYKVTIRGFHRHYFHESMVVAEDAAQAYTAVRDVLDSQDYGFHKDRELQSVELLASDEIYPDTPSRLFIVK